MDVNHFGCFSEEQDIAWMMLFLQKSSQRPWLRCITRP